MSHSKFIYDFCIIKPRKSMDYETVQEQIKDKLIINGRLSSKHKDKSTVEKLLELYENIFFYTSFLKKNIDVKIRIYCVFNKIKQYPKCKYCGKKLTKSRKSLKNFTFGKFCSYKCNGSINNNSKLTLNQKVQVNKKIQTTVLRQRQFGLSTAWKEKLKKAANKIEVQEKRKQTNLHLYGVENAGVLGAFNSKAALKYIEKFIQSRNISKDNCFYSDKVNNKKEFFQMIYIAALKKQRYFSYDLVVFENNSKDLNKIQLILEYNGPWHYTKNEILGHENEPACPYKKNNSYKFTKKECYELEQLKLNHMYKYTKNIFIFNNKTKQLTPWIPE